MRRTPSPSVANFSKIVVVLIALVAMNCVASQTKAPQEVRVSVEEIKRKADGDLQIWLKVENLTERSIFLPVVDVNPAVDPSKLLYVQFVVVEQWQPEKGWQFVGPRRDVPPPAVAEVAPGHSVRGSVTIGETLLLSEGGGKIKIQGKHRIKVRYFNSKDEWDNYWADLRSGRTPRPKLGLVVSKPFNIPPLASRD